MPFKFNLSIISSYSPSKANSGELKIETTERRVIDKWWEDIVLALIGEQLGEADQVFGVQLSSPVIEKKYWIGLLYRLEQGDELELKQQIKELTGCDEI